MFKIIQFLKCDVPSLRISADGGCYSQNTCLLAKTRLVLYYRHFVCEERISRFQVKNC